MLNKTYQPDDVEPRRYAAWEKSGVFAADERSNGQPFTVMMPPPNVTGSLHIGHALNHTLQDVLVRYHRMSGRNTLWQPGTDHAGIATQMVVERQLESEGSSRAALGRDDFVERVWQWRQESGGTILGQLRRLGDSADWARERFTMDEGLSAAVRKVFVQLHREGLIYRDQRLVNWDPKLGTAISDLEVDNRDVKGKLWYFRYAIEGEPDRTITVATTRPETMLGDSGIAVHPDDARYADLVGRYAVLPIVGRRLKIVADTYSDPEKGSGAVKITPAHDFNDFEVGRRHDLEMINIFNGDASLNEAVPEAYRGLDRFAARERIVAAMEALGLLEKVEEHAHTVPYGDRSDVVIEPWLTTQWYVDAKTLAKPAIEAVEEGRTRFVPQQFENVYFEWMRNIQPWCISRQLWWGHRIPAWYAPDGTIFVAESEDEARIEAEARFGAGVALRQDEDVLDTWFSSGLWPFSTLGWPERTPALERFYPGDVLVTAFDIIFFWVARMMMFGLHFMGDVPFRTVVIHALVRDSRGQKMSKSKGNIIDPLDFIERYGADALRFTLAALTAQGRDVKLAEDRVAGYRNFATKLWNAARFCEMNECRFDPDFDPAEADQTVNRWIIGRTADTVLAVSEALDAFRFNEAASALYQFLWHTYCDWYLEFAKPVLSGEDGAARAETQATASWVLGRSLHLLHPFMPFITEELWDNLAGGEKNRLIVSPWPDEDRTLVDKYAQEEMDWLVRTIGAIRTVRAEINVPAAARLPVMVAGGSEMTIQRFETYRDTITRMARLDAERIVFSPTDSGEAAVRVLVDEATLVLPLAGVIDIAVERERLHKEIQRLDGEVAGFDRKLANPQFVARAPEDVVEEQREKRHEAEQARNRLAAALEQLAAA